MTFADTSGWFASMVPTDPDHARAKAWYDDNTEPLLTTDYVVDETLTLLRKRGHRSLAVSFGRSVFGGKLGPVHFVTPGQFRTAWDVFHKYADKDWSFTDCTSKVVMEEFGITQAFSFDKHFRQFGTVTVVP